MIYTSKIEAHCSLYICDDFVPPLAIIGGGRRYDFFLCRLAGSVHCLLTPVSYDAISQYVVQRFGFNLAQMVVMSVGIAEEVLKVRGQRSRS